MTTRAYVDRLRISLGGARLQIETLDLNLTHRLPVGEHWLSWGLGYRRAEDKLPSPLLLGPPGPPVSAVLSFDNLHEETLTAYELGWRSFVGDNWAFDLALFYNDYEELQSFTLGVGVPLPVFLGNGPDGESVGLELSGEWRISDSLRMEGSYSWIDLEIDSTALPGLVPFNSPKLTARQLFKLQSYWKPSADWQFDASLAHVDLLNADPGGGTSRSPGVLGLGSTPGAADHPQPEG